MSREEDRIKDIEYWDKHRAGALGGVNAGYVNVDDPYAHMTEDDKRRMLSDLRRRDEEDRRAAENVASSYAFGDKLREAHYGRRVERQGEYRKALSAHLDFEEARLQGEQEREMKKQAVDRAKKRYNSLSPLMKLFNKNPSKVNFNSMSIAQINQMYQGKKR